MIHVVRKRGGQGAHMYRVYCVDCQGFTFGWGKSRYMSWWHVAAGARRAQQHHQDLHKQYFGRAQIMLKRCIAEHVSMNSGTYEEVSSIPTIAPGEE